MKLKINEQLLCIPPYISTTWDQVAFLQTEQDPQTMQLMLILHLIDGKIISIPHLDSSIIDIAFAAHMKHLEQSTQKKESQPKAPGNVLQQLFGISPEQMTALPIRFGISGIPGIENLEAAFQHNSAGADIPDLPKEVLEKIAGITKLLTNGDPSVFPKPEPHCNCPHCQLGRAVHGLEKEEESKEESHDPITEEDLSFRSWDIKQCGEKLFIVTNPLDSQEQYSVYLGTPVGCTCGKPHCEHIQAVLYS